MRRIARMKISLLVSCLLAVVAIAACGGGDDPDDPAASAEAKSAEPGLIKVVPGTEKPPAFGVPPGPPPKKLITRDVKKGTGVEIQPRRRFTTNYVALEYGSGDPVEDYWKGESFNWCWRTGGLTKGWEVGLEGMRVGGQRELIVPSQMAYGSGARVYMIELLSVE